MLCSTYPQCTEPLKEPLDNDWHLKHFLWPTSLTTLFSRKLKRNQTVLLFLFLALPFPEKSKHSLSWQRWHLPAADRLRLTARQRATAPPAHIARRARWVDPAILWTPFSSLPACLETRSLGDPAVWPPLADTADPHTDTLVRLTIFLLSFIAINCFLSPVASKW